MRVWAGMGASNIRVVIIVSRMARDVSAGWSEKVSDIGPMAARERICRMRACRGCGCAILLQASRIVSRGLS